MLLFHNDCGCARDYNHKHFEKDDDDSKEYDLVCGERKVSYRICHISALGGDTSMPHYEFTPYSYFDYATAEETCRTLGGKLP